MTHQRSRLEEHAADALRRARKLPVGPARNDLRQLAAGLLWLHRRGMKAVMDELALHRMTDSPSTAVTNAIQEEFHTA